MSGRYDGPVTSRRSRAASAAVVAVLIASLSLAACNTARPVASATSPAAPSPSTALTPVPGGSSAASPLPPASLPTQTDTEWGRIWDALPASFPLPPGAVPTETGEGPTSATVQVPGTAEVAATTIQSALTGQGFQFDAMNGPAEDGGYTLEAVGPGRYCKAQIRAAPLGDATIVAVLYGAGCPFE
jgi:hypothetical protein